MNGLKSIIGMIYKSFFMCIFVRKYRIQYGYVKINNRKYQKYPKWKY